MRRTRATITAERKRPDLAFRQSLLAAPVGGLPLRVTVSLNSESDRYFRASDVDLDKFGLSARVEYVDPANDQAFSREVHGIMRRREAGPVT